MLLESLCLFILLGWSSGDVPLDHHCPQVDPTSTTTLYPHETDCTKFYMLVVRPCAPGTEFSVKENDCVQPHLSECKKTITTKPTTPEILVTTPKTITRPTNTHTGVTKQLTTKIPISVTTNVTTATNKLTTTMKPFVTIDHDVTTKGTTERSANYTLSTIKDPASTSEAITTIKSVVTTKIVNTSTTIKMTSANAITTAKITATVPKTTNEATSSPTTARRANNQTTFTTLIPKTTLSPNARCAATVGEGRPLHVPDESCSTFYKCFNGTATLTKCPYYLYFNKDLQVCDWPQNVDCPSGPFPLVPSSVSTVSNLSSSTSKINPAPRCPAVDPLHLPHETNCSRFYKCGRGAPRVMTCPKGLHYSKKLQICDWPIDAGCSVSLIPVTVRPSPKPKPRCPAIDSPEFHYLPHESDCSKFYVCNYGEGTIIQCPNGLHFNIILLICDSSKNAKCDETYLAHPHLPAVTTQKPSTTQLQDSDNIIAWPNTGSAAISFAGRCPVLDGPASIYFPHENCNKFYQCSNGRAYLRSCPASLHFNKLLQVCDWPERAGCKNETTVPKTTSHPRTTKTTPHPPTTKPVQHEELFTTTTTRKAEDRCSRTCVADHWVDDSDCRFYWRCNNSVAVRRRCPANLKFNKEEGTCDLEDRVKC